jgi:hydroxyacylglutathione hydrolase
LHQETILYPGHDYLNRNLRFTLDYEPGNEAARSLLASAAAGDDAPLRFTNLLTEREINLFMRLNSRELREKVLSHAEPTAPSTDEALFLRLRAIRDRWAPSPEIETAAGRRG